ncbi:hypothetical protein LF845_06595 [Deferribacterales bacterium Es71-Z0220]|jgi:CRISPR-associated protein Cmr5|uniref:type III-B CRISPR module-associated protein Cmr5 n=1 Tax=Deferrivibrio essentukiensis TaxID=2880922 RepID=UPI001F619CBD|nr:type III-B CRISPR module-associated protein Cmr5 [Deferrivibrio essentukiensis]MCB4204626.1 hypothetical protein [Deferrivibrio essentukiensis]
MNAVEKLIPYALEAAEQNLAESGKIKKVYNGYISGFGATVIQAGLIPAAANLEKDTDRTKGSRRLIADALLHILEKMGYKDIDKKSLTRTAIKYKEKIKFKNDILDAATALKLAIRTFKLED